MARGWVTFDQKNDIHVPDVSWWAWPCPKYFLNVIAAERCKKEQGENRICKSCSHKADGRKFNHEYANKVQNAIYTGPSTIHLCKYSSARDARYLVEECPMNKENKSQSYRCFFKSQMRLESYNASHCSYFDF